MEVGLVRVLFVCTGNICRSPTAEGIFRSLVVAAGLDGQIDTDSAGTHDYHAGEPPDPRALEAARAREIDITALRARRVQQEDFSRFDLIVAMDRGHLRQLRRIAPPGTEDRVVLFMRFAPELGLTDVPDPYYGGAEGFERVLDMVQAGAAGLLAHIRADHL